ncbi:MAG TPA: MBL fold metallo-hydrolase [Gemmatimonadales bacterium]|nr:MBL fold metallo-hydrolase [Gemmatimonadales bacterium]
MHIVDFAPELGFLHTAIVNCYFYGRPGAGDRRWVLVDAGVPGFAGSIARAASHRFGRNARPQAIVLTHGHFDHVGTLGKLAEHWDAPIYAHELELPYLVGEAAYPPPEPRVGGGAIAAMSPLFPRGPFDFRPRMHMLPADGSVPGMPGWRWVHTPGHTPGHVSLFRESDRTLIAGDAFVTTNQASLTASLTNRPGIHGPPPYYTPDWGSSWESVELLSALEPEVAGTGHGPPMRGEAMRRGLRELARNFDRLAVPPRGRYVESPQVEVADIYAPPSRRNPAAVAAIGLALLMAGTIVLRARR